MKEVVTMTDVKKNPNLFIAIPTINKQILTFKIIGESPLVVHNWVQKAKRHMNDIEVQRSRRKNSYIPNPMEEFIESLYWIEGKPTEYTEEAFAAAVQNGARFGFPSTVFKSSAVTGGYRSGFTKDKVSVYGMFHINGEMVEIIGTPVMRKDMIRVANGDSIPRYRGMFPQWEAMIELTYNANVVTPEQIVNLFACGGKVCGIGEWRLEKGGDWGRYRAVAI